MKSSGNTLGEIEIEYKFYTTSVSYNTVELDIDLKLIQQNMKDVRWQEKLKIPIDSKVTFRPFESVSMNISSSRPTEKK